MYPTPSPPIAPDGASYNTMSEMELRFSCTQLKNMDILSKSDPTVEVYAKKDGRMEKIGRTEIIYDTLSPEFETSVRIDYHFEEQQLILLRVLDVDGTKKPATQNTPTLPTTASVEEKRLAYRNRNSSMQSTTNFRKSKQQPSQFDVDITDFDLIGETLFYLSGLVASPGMTLTQRLSLNPTEPNQRGGSGSGKTNSNSAGGPRGMITIRAEEVVDSNEICKFSNLSARDLPATTKWFFGLWNRSLPSIWFTRSTESGGEQVVYKTEVLNSCSDYNKIRNPSKCSSREYQFKDFEISAQQLCNSDHDRPIWVKVVDNRDPDKLRDMGQIQLSLNLIQEKMDELSCKGLDLRRKGKYLSSPEDAGSTTSRFQPEGAIAMTLDFIEKPRFLDFIKGGLNLNLHCCVDFTGSNGDPADPRSLHYIGGGGKFGGGGTMAAGGGHRTPNQYEQVIQAVGSILREYDSDKLIPFYGFGARVPRPDGTLSPVQHCFPINLSGAGKPEVLDLPGMLYSYREALPKIRLAGPTLFAPLLTQFINNVKDELRVAYKSDSNNSNAVGMGMMGRAENDYHILLILTDGVIHDLDATIDCIIDSELKSDFNKVALDH